MIISGAVFAAAAILAAALPQQQPHPHHQQQQQPLHPHHHHHHHHHQQQQQHPHPHPHHQQQQRALGFATDREAFEIWKSVFGRNYSSAAEEELRYSSYVANVGMYERRNASEPFATFAPDNFSDCSVEELASLGGLDGPLNTTGYQVPASQVAYATTIPISHDWRDHGYVTSVKNQGYCGSCWAFAAIASTEAAVVRQGGALMDLSSQELVSCAQYIGPYGVDWIAQNGGINSWEAYPYDWTNCPGTCDQILSKISVATIAGATCLPNDGDEVAIKSWVYTTGPLMISIAADGLAGYSSGIVTALCTERNINHAVTIVGFGEENGVSYWIVKNSWGTGFGEGGYFRMQYGVNCMNMAYGGPCMVTSLPTASPTSSAAASTFSPTRSPTPSPTFSPTRSPTTSSTFSPTNSLTTSPTLLSTMSSTTSSTFSPTNSPTTSPTLLSTRSPNASPSSSPSNLPTESRTSSPATISTTSPTSSTTTSLTTSPTFSPTRSPIDSQTSSPASLSTSTPTSTQDILPPASPIFSQSRSPAASPTSTPTTPARVSNTEHKSMWKRLNMLSWLMILIAVVAGCACLLCVVWVAQDKAKSDHAFDVSDEQANNTTESRRAILMFAPFLEHYKRLNQERAKRGLCDCEGIEYKSARHATATASSKAKLERNLCKDQAHLEELEPLTPSTPPHSRTNQKPERPTYLPPVKDEPRDKAEHSLDNDQARLSDRQEIL